MKTDRSSVEGQLGLPLIIALSAVNIAFSMFGIVGNVLICLAVWKNGFLQVGMNYFVVNLSIADLLVCIFTQPMYVLSLNGFTEHYFKLFFFVVTSTSLYASLNNLLLLTLNRLAAVIYPLKYKAFTHRKNLVISLSVVWCISSIEGILRTFTSFKTITPFLRITAVGLFVLMYSKVFREASKQQRRICMQEKSINFNHKIATIKSDNRATKTAAIVVGSFVLSFLPITLLLLIDSSNKVAVELCFSIMCCSSAVNPLVYAWRSGPLRAAVLSSVPCCRGNSVRQRPSFYPPPSTVKISESTLSYKLNEQM